MFRKGKHIDTRQRFTIKKFKIGAASVLIGTVFAGFGTHVQADEVTVAEPTVTTLASTEETTETGDAEPAAPVATEEAVATEVAPVAEAVVSNDFAVETSDLDDTDAVVSEKATTKPEVEETKPVTITPEVTKPVTKGYKATNTVPTSTATERPTNEGQALPTGTSFRADTTATPTVTNPMPEGYTIGAERLTGDLEKFADKDPNQVTFTITKNTVTDTYFRYSYNKTDKQYYITQMNADGSVVKTLTARGAGESLYFEDDRTRLDITARASQEGSSNLAFVVSYYKTVEGAKAGKGGDIEKAFSSLFIDGYPDKTTVGRAVNFVTTYSPLEAYSTTNHINLLTGEKIHPDVVQAGYTGETYTTRAFDKAGEAGANFDVLRPLNAEGVLTTASWREKGQVEETQVDVPATIYKDGKQQSTTFIRKLRYEIVNEQGDMKIEMFMAEKPTDGSQPVFEKMSMINPDIRETVKYKVDNVTYNIKVSPIITEDVIVKPSTSDTGPYNVAFAAYGTASGIGTEAVAKGFKPQEGWVISDSRGFIRNPYRRASDEVKYYYTQENAVVKFFDVTEGKNDLNEDVTGISGKGETAITPEMGQNASGQKVADIIKKYEALGYKVETNGFNDKPTFKPTTATYPEYSPLTEEETAALAAPDLTEEKRKEIMAKVEARREEERQVNEAERRDANKQTVEITLVKKKGSVVVNYVDENGTPIPGADAVTAVNNEPIINVVGEQGTPATYDTTAQKRPTITVGDKTYELVPTKSAVRSETGTFAVANTPVDNATGTLVEGTTYVNYVYREVPKTPEAPKPEEVTETKKITRTIVYNKIELNGETTEAAPTYTTEVEYTRTGTKDPITKEITWNNWTPKGDNVLEGNPLPTPEGYEYISTFKSQGDLLNQKGTKESTTQNVETTPEMSDIIESVTFRPVQTPPPAEQKQGDVVVKYVKEGTTEEIANPVADENNKPYETAYNTSDNRPNEIVGKDGKTYVFVKRSDNSAPEEGTITEPLTTVVYEYKEKAKGNVVVNYRIEGDENTPIKDPVNDTTDAYVGTDYNTSEHKTPTIQYNGKTYELVPDQKTPNETGEVTEGTTNVTYYYKEVPPTPEAPKTGTVVIEYVDTKGNPIKTSVVDDKDVPVGTDYDTTDEDGKPSTITVGKDKYVLVPSLTQGTENGKVVEGTTTITYVYQKVANWIPELPAVPDKDRPRTPYPFNPEEPKNPIPGIPTNPETGIPVIPHVDGYVPNVPGTTDPLKPVDPKDPSKGYIPPSPENIEEDTRIPYTPVKRGTVIVHYEDTAGNVLKTPVTDENNVPVGTDYNTTDEGDKPTKLTRDGENYVLVPSKTRGTEEGKVVEGTTEVTYVYQKVANWIPLIPGEPNPPKTPYPFDPTKPEDPIPTDPKVPGVPVIPYVPGYEPEIPLQPVDPEDPSKGYIPPVPETPGKDTPIPYVPAKGTVIVKYRDVDGNPLKDPVTDEDNVPVGTEYNTTDEGDKPSTLVHDGENYVLVPSLTEGTEEGKVTKGTTTITYVYQKVANWIPLIPGEPNPPKTPYPFNPEKPGDPIPAIPEVPGKPGVPVIPYVPGYEPEIPLQPVDPEDPSKGYIPPVPETPGKDTRIPYVPAYGTVVIEYKDVNGNPIKTPVTDENNVRVDTPYNTTDEGDKPTTIITEDGTRYVLVPSLTVGDEEGKVTKGTTTITYVYQKVANWIPLIPGEPNPPKTPYPFDPENPGNPIPAVPEVPGKPGVPVIPFVPGYEPFDPTDPTKPLQPVDPEDPSKGYIPPVPTTPGEDTLIPYKPVPPTTPNIPGVEIPEQPTDPGKPTPPAEPGKPVEPGQPTPPAEPGKPTPPAEPGKPAEPTTMTELPKTGDAGSVAASAFGIGTLLASLGLVAPRRKKD